jgi:hypothetical protein
LINPGFFTFGLIGVMRGVIAVLIETVISDDENPFRWWVDIEYTRVDLSYIIINGLPLSLAYIIENPVRFCEIIFHQCFLFVIDSVL